MSESQVVRIGDDLVTVEEYNAMRREFRSSGAARTQDWGSWSRYRMSAAYERDHEFEERSAERRAEQLRVHNDMVAAQAERLEVQRLEGTTRAVAWVANRTVPGGGTMQPTAEAVAAQARLREIERDRANRPRSESSADVMARRLGRGSSGDGEDFEVIQQVAG